MTVVCRGTRRPSTDPSTPGKACGRRLSSGSVEGVEGVEGLGIKYRSSGEPEQPILLRLLPGIQPSEGKSLNCPQHLNKSRKPRAIKRVFCRGSLESSAN